MKLTIKTAKFQDMVQRASKGASENKLLPITSMMAIELKDNVLTLTTTDTSNTLKVRATEIPGEDFYVVVPVDKFTKLITKSTSENITLTLKDKSLEVKSNGIYNIELPVDEDGLIKFPEYTFKKKGKGLVINLTSIHNIISTNKAALSKVLEAPCLCGYYIGERAITTDENVICFNDINLVKENILVSPETMELLTLNTQEKIKYFHTGTQLLFETDDVIVHGYEHEGMDMYPIKELNDYLEVEFPSMCKLPKLLLQSVMDRLSLFIEPYDKNGAYFKFTSEGVEVSSKRSKSIEVISYSESKNFSPFICCVDIPMLKSQVDSNPGELIELHYGHPAAIKLVSGNVTQVIALLEDDSLESVNE